MAFGNGNLLGGNFHFGGEADPTDGKMKMILVPGRGFFYKMKNAVCSNPEQAGSVRKFI